MNTRMQFLEHALAVEGHETQHTEDAEGGQSAPLPPSAQITRLEHRINALEALVNGLTDEILDLKTVTRKLSDALAKFNDVPATPMPPREGIRRPPVAQPQQAAAVPSPSVTRQPQQQPPQAPMPSRAPAQAQQSGERRVISAPGGQRATAKQPDINPLPSEEAQAAAESESLANGQYEYVMQPDGTIMKRQKTKGVKNVIIAGTGFGKGSVSRSNAIRAESSAVIEADEVQETVEL